jgi:hypothetical protein
MLHALDVIKNSIYYHHFYGNVSTNLEIYLMLLDLDYLSDLHFTDNSKQTFI